MWAPPSKQSIGDSERYEVSYCTKAGHGTRLIPPGTLTGVHWQWTEKFVQITGTGKFTQMNIPAGDDGGELDPHGADGNGNPIGGLVLSNIGGKTFQFKEWTQFSTSPCSLNASIQADTHLLLFSFSLGRRVLYPCLLRRT